MNKINEVLKSLNKKYGAGSTAVVKDKEDMDIKAIRSGCFSLDWVFGCGGLPKGRILEFFGAESSGKSTLALFLIAEVQRQGGTAVLIDAECAYSTDYAKKIGVDTDKLIVNQPIYGEEGLEVLQKLVETGEIDIVVVDSVASLVPKRELDGLITDAEMAMQARMLSKALRMLAGLIAQKKTIVIFINQLREKVGVYFGKKDTTPGGKALKFYASVRLEVKKGKQIKRGEEIIGNWMIINAVKNKVGFPFRTTEFELIYQEGIDTIGDLLDFSVDNGLIKKNGMSYELDGKKLGIGRDKAKTELAKDPKLVDSLKEKLKSYATNGKKTVQTNEKTGTNDQEAEVTEEED